MGLDFSSLLRTDSRNDMAIVRLETQPVEDAAVRVLRKWKQCGYFELEICRPMWVCGHDVEAKRPVLPSLDRSLRTREGFFLTFGKDAVLIYHPLRWHRYLVDAEWQELMLDAVKSYSRIVGATDGVVTNDSSPVIQGFQNGMGFGDAIATGIGQEGEVDDAKSLLTRIGDDGTWDSHGYWRFMKRA